MGSKGGGGGSVKMPSGLGQIMKGGSNLLADYSSQLYAAPLGMANWAADIATGGNFVPSTATGPGSNLFHGISAAGYPGFTAGQSGMGTTGGGSAGSSAWGNNSLLGPLLSQAWDAIKNQEANANTVPGMIGSANQAASTADAQSQGLYNTGDWLMNNGVDMVGQGRGILGQGQQMVTDATTGTGLFKSQQAMVDQATKSQQAAITQQLASEGLSGSTMNAQMRGQAAQQGAATAGGLIQGNIAAGQAQEQVGISQEQAGMSQEQVAQNNYNLAQGAQKIALGNRSLAAGEQQALSSELANIASQSSAIQQGMWNESVQGYGVLGQLMNTTLSAYGVSTNVAAVEGNVSAGQASAQNAAASAGSQGFSSLLGGVGSLLGGGGGGGGGLGGLLGGAGAALTGGSGIGGLSGVAGLGSGAGVLGTSVGGALGGIGSAIGGAGSAIVGGIGTVLSFFV